MPPTPPSKTRGVATLPLPLGRTTVVCCPNSVLSTLVIVLPLLKLSSLVAVGNNDEISAGEYDIKFIILQLCLRTRFLLR